MSMVGRRDRYEPMRTAWRNGWLSRFITDAWFRPDSPATRMSRFLLHKDPSGIRYHDELRGADIAALSGVGFRSLFGRMAQGRAQLHRFYMAMGSRFARESIKRLDIEHSAFVGFTSASLEALEYERRQATPTVLHQIHGARLEERVVREEIERHNSWLLGKHDPIPQEYFERIAAEWAAADTIVVNSEWTKTALLEEKVPASKMKICPLMYEGETVAPMVRARRSTELKVLWLGSLSLRKGIVYAIEAARLLEKQPVSFTFTGFLDVNLPALPANCRYIGRPSWSEIPGLYASHDLFILPTLSDAFGITQIEAMYYGLPVISTPRCGEVVEDGMSGAIVPPGDSKALAEAIGMFLSRPALVDEMSAAALARSQNYTRENVWRRYSSFFQ
jgi:glycosyltransferase involved in cell wall biosynthesis